MKVFLALTLACLAFASGEKVSYDGHRVLRVNVEDVGHAAKLAELEDTYDFWNNIKVQQVPLLIRHCHYMVFLSNLNRNLLYIRRTIFHTEHKKRILSAIDY